MDQLANFAVHSLPAREILRDGNNISDTPRTLNPAFVEVLMGWPIAWTGSDFAAMEWSRWLRRMRFEFWRLGSLATDDGWLL